jgi:hypothetical protein
MVTLTDDRMILICALMFFIGAVWGAWLGYGHAKMGSTLDHDEQDL